MRARLLLVAAIVTAGAPVFAAQTDNSEFDVIAVMPRSPDVQPYFLSVPAEGRQKVVTHPEVENLAKARKSANSASGFHPEETSAKVVTRRCDSSRPQSTECIAQ